MLSKLREFILPESKLTLKLYFDNVRNYAICGALLAFSVWLYRQWLDLNLTHAEPFSVGPINIQLSEVDLLASLITVNLVLVALLLLNILQTWFLVLHPLIVRITGSDPFAAAHTTTSIKYSKERPWLLVLLASLTLLLLNFPIVQIAMSIAALASAFAAK